MAVYRAVLSIENPLTGEARLLKFKFDPASLTLAKWSAAYPQIQAKVDELVAAAATSEPQGL